MRLPARLRWLIGKVQRGVIFVLLLLVYLFVFGITLVFAALLDRRVFYRDRRGQETFWKEAQDYGPDLDKARHQS